jgi:dienelactone hydrolase
MVTALEMPREAHLVRASRPDGGRSYLLYLPVAREGAPMVVVTQPYAGIDWTGEDVDARWAAHGPGAHPDDEAPAYDGDDVIAYEPQSPQQAAEASAVWLANQVAVVHAYGRFYAGGSIEDDALDAAAPYHFARTRGELDATHLGAWGGSWGAFMAMFGAARAPKDAAPVAVGALWGPSD